MVFKRNLSRFWILAAIAGLLAACGEDSATERAAPETEPPVVEASDAERVAPMAGAVVTIPSGLRYEVLVAADGPQPAADAAVLVHYEGRLQDGTVFDSSLERGAPASFRLNQVIAGWTEALQLMSPGAKWRLTIPPELAYGDQGAGDLIGPGATLIFDVELLDFEREDEEGAPPASQ